MINRHLDGVYFRVKRNDRWKSICLSDMTEEERHQLFQGERNTDPKFLIGCIDALCESIRRIGDTFDIAGGSDDEEED